MKITAPSGTKFCKGCANKGNDPFRPLDAFASKTKGTKQARCRDCHNEQMRAHYANNYNAYKSKTIKKRQTELTWYREFKSTLKCNRCPENHPACIQFHHIDPSTKEVTLSFAIRKGWNRQRVLAEIAKCEVLCANCHTKEHYRLRVQAVGVEPTTFSSVD